MKTAEEKAKEFIVKFGGHLRIEVAHELTKLIIEQDRDTRQACAEAVISLDGYMNGPPFGYSKMILADEAHTACMNVKAA